jgi:hypothetical protein
LIEQDRRSIKLRLGPMLGFRQFRSAATTIAGKNVCAPSRSTRSMASFEGGGEFAIRSSAAESPRQIEDRGVNAGAHDGFLGAKDTET